MRISWFIEARDPSTGCSDHLFDSDGEMPREGQLVWINNMLTPESRMQYRRGMLKHIGGSGNGQRKYVVKSCNVVLTVVDVARARIADEVDFTKFNSSEEVFAACEKWLRDSGFHPDGYCLESHGFIGTEQKAEVVLAAVE